jgi:hypothetical protein
MMMMSPPIRRSDTKSNLKSLRSGSFGTFLLVLAILSTTFYAPSRATTTPSQPFPAAHLEMTPPVLSTASGALLIGAGSKLDVWVLALKPIAMELGVVVILQSIGLPMVSKLGFLARRVRWASIGRGIGISAKAAKNMQVTVEAGGRLWKQMVLTYSRTSASKIVGRSKRIVNLFRPHDDDDDEEKAH